MFKTKFMELHNICKLTKENVYPVQALLGTINPVNKSLASLGIFKIMHQLILYMHDL